jgi:hypothetical protein
VPATLEVGSPPGTYDLTDSGGITLIGTNDEHISIVVASRELRVGGIAHQRRPNSFDLVRGDGHPDARSAHEDSAVDLAGANCAPDLRREVRIVDRIFGVRTDILNPYAQLAQGLHDDSFGRYPAVIAANDGG